MRALGLLIGCLAFSACTPSPPVEQQSSRAEASARQAGATSAPPSAASAASSAPEASASAAEAPAAPPEIDLSKQPALRDDEGKVLGQTEDKPTTDSPAFRARLELLWKAIVAGDPEIADAAVFFPVEAYEQVKDIKSPAADHKSRLRKAFARDVRAYHKELGPDPAATKLLGLEVDEKRLKWMKPGSEGNKLGYWRVTRSKIRYADASGVEKTLELTSLISWRGEWFVVHLHGFK